MADQVAEYLLEYHFTSGRSLEVLVREGRDRIDESVPGRSKVTVYREDGTHSTLTIHTDKLDGVTSTMRLVDVEPPTIEQQVDALVANG